MHDFMTYGAMGANGHTMTAADTELIPSINHGRKSLFGFKLDNAHRTHGSTDTIALTFFLINV
jgi:hypothetical protein